MTDSPVTVRGTVRRWAAATVLSAFVITFALPGVAIADPTPTGGPTSGGTSVSGVLPGPVQFTSVAISTAQLGETVYGLARDGNVYAWGYNAQGQVGNGTSGSPVTTASQVSMPAAAVPVAQVAAGFLGGYAIGADGKVYAWGSNTVGQIGDGTSGTSVLAPTPVNLPAAALPAVEVAGYNQGGYALGADGNVYAWGGNSSGQVGNGTSAGPVLAPVRVSLSAAALPVRQVAAGGNSGYAVGADGSLYAWGDNSSGQIGRGAAGGTYPSPFQVLLPPAALPVVKVVGHQLGGYAIGADRKMYAWGGNTSGQIGTGVTGSSVPTPTVVGLPAAAMPVAQITAGTAAGFALGGDGRMYSWGANQSGQLGTGTTVAMLTPAAVDLPASVLPVTQLAAGGYTGFALGPDANLSMWGNNGVGAAGNGTVATPVLRPTVVPTDVSVQEVLFGGVAGTTLTQQLRDVDGERQTVWTADTPSLCGAVDIQVTWTQLGLSHTDLYPGGFSAGSPPTVTGQPTSGVVAQGGTYTTAVAVSGDSAPNVQWQVSPDGTSWTDIPGATSETLVATDLEHDTHFRASVSNCWGDAYSAFSEPVAATVQRPPTAAGGQTDVGEGGSHTFAADPRTTGSIDRATVTVPPAAGTATAAPDGTVRFEAGSAAPGTYSFDVTFTDDLGQSIQASFVVTVTAAPAVPAEPPPAAAETLAAPAEPPSEVSRLLAQTGADVPVAVALVLFLAGAGTLVFARRHSTGEQ